MLRPMNGHPTKFSLICQLFLVFTFLCVPIADSGHAIRMSSTKHDDSRSVNKLITQKSQAVMAANLPCHTAAIASGETSIEFNSQTNKTGDKNPCCPYKHCSPSHCLMQTVAASAPTFEISPHSPIDTRVFVEVETHVVLMPLTEPLRPPIVLV